MLIAAAISGLTLWAAPSRAGSESSVVPPNVVLIVADDLGWNDVPWHDSNMSTVAPTLETLGEQGMRLERFYVAPVCTPTRMALLTGRYPIRWGMQEWVINDGVSDYGLPRTEEILPEFLAKSGYSARLAVGKWHLGGRYSKYHPISAGFSEFLGNYVGVVTYDTLMNSGQVDWHDGFENETSPWSFGSGPPQPECPVQRHTQLVAERAVAFIEDHHDEPFLLYVPFLAVHSVGEDDDRTQYLQRLCDMDARIGEILAALDTHQIADRTIVWFLSDNGGAEWVGADNTPLRGEKSTVYDGGIRSASVIRYPDGGLTGGVEPDLISHVDVLPTLRGLIEDVTGPLEDFLNPLDGRDMSSALDGAATEPQPCDSLEPTECDDGEPPAPCKEHFSFVERDVPEGRAYRYSLIRHDPNVVLDPMDDELWKVVINLTTPLDVEAWLAAPYPVDAELYELISDEGEQVDLASDPTLTSMKQSLIESLCCWLALEPPAGPAPLPLPNPNNPFPGWRFGDVTTPCETRMLVYRDSPTASYQKFAILHSDGTVEDFNDTRNAPDGTDGLLLQGIGRSSLDGLLYGVTQDGQELYQIDGRALPEISLLPGLVLRLGSVRGIPTSATISAGDVAPDGESYLCFDDSADKLYSIELGNLVATEVVLGGLSGAVKIPDFAFGPSGEILAYDETSNRVLVIDSAGQVSWSAHEYELGSTGAVWAHWAGNPLELTGDLVVQRRIGSFPPKGLYRLDLDTGAMHFLHSVPGLHDIDGAGSLGAASDHCPWAGGCCEDGF